MILKLKKKFIKLGVQDHFPPLLDLPSYNFKNPRILTYARFACSDCDANCVSRHCSNVCSLFPCPKTPTRDC